MQADLAVIKSLLLRSDQFPQVPSGGGLLPNGRSGSAKELSGEIPAWQRNADSPDKADNEVDFTD